MLNSCHPIRVQDLLVQSSRLNQQVFLQYRLHTGYKAPAWKPDLQSQAGAWERVSTNRDGHYQTFHSIGTPIIQ